jgi:hypothetical protein
VPRSPNTMHLRSSDKIPSLVRDRHNDLSSCVEHLACHLGTLDPEEWAAALHRRINRAIGRKRHEKLTSWHLKNIAMKPTSEKTAVPKAIVQSVFLKSALRKPGQSVDTDELIKRAKQIEMGDLREECCQKKAQRASYRKKRRKISGANFAAPQTPKGLYRSPKRIRLSQDQNGGTRIQGPAFSHRCLCCRSTNNRGSHEVSAKAGGLGY